jgi:hypothetical protein
MLKTLLHHQKIDMVVNKEWLLTLREECKLWVLRRIFGPKRDKVTREWRKLHNEKLYDLYSSPNIVRMIKLRRIRWAGHVAHMGRGVYRVVVGETEGKRPLVTPRHRCEDNTKMDLKEVGFWDMNWFRIGTGGGHL